MGKKKSLRKSDEMEHVESFSSDVSSKQRKVEKEEEYQKGKDKSKRKHSESPDKNTVFEEQDVVSPRRKKKRKTEHEKSEMHERLEVKHEPEFKQSENSEVEQQEVSTESQRSTLEEETNSLVRKAFPASKLETFEPQELKSFLAGQNEDSGVAMANEEYSIKPVNDIVQPPFIPSPDKPRRNTNQLQFIAKNVLKAVMKHHFSWPFHHPVNAIELKRLDYYDIIKSPMDLTTIKKRLENCWYYSAEECQKDFMTMFNNCYQYNELGEDVVLMAEAIEEVYKTKIAAMPDPEVELPMPNVTSPGSRGKGKKGEGAGRPRGKTEHEKSEMHERLEVKREPEFKQSENSEVEQEEVSTESQRSTLEEEETNSLVRKAFPASKLETFGSQELKSFLAGQGMNMKEWKKKRKEEYRIWKEAKETRKLECLEKSKSTENLTEDVQGSSGKGIHYTTSIALPGSILDNAQSPELKTYLAGQIARAAAVFSITEIIVFEETGLPSAVLEDEDAPIRLWHKQGSIQMCKILQFLECPQYLRKNFFPLQKDLEFAGVLNPLDTLHHLRVDDVSQYREGVTLDKPLRDGKKSFAYIGFQKTAIIDKAIKSNIRVTIKLDEKQQVKKHFTGTVVSPSAPYKQDGIYWGYNVRLAESLSAVFSKCPYKEGYDLTIGTSDKGKNVDHCVLPPFKHLLIVFGGLKGLEASLEADEALTADDPSFLFHHYLNTCPSQGSRTIRTEEAVLITLSVLRPKILQCQSSS